MFNFDLLIPNNFKRILDTCMDSIVITDHNGYIMYVNESFEATTGYTEQEVIGKKPNILKSGKMPKEYYKQLWNTIRQNKEWNGEFLNKDKEGNLFWEFARIIPVKDIHGNTFYVGIKQNITKIKELEEKLIALYDRANSIPV